MAIANEGLLPEVFDQIYAAAYEPGLWRGALGKAAEALGVSGVTLMADTSLHVPAVGSPEIDGLAEDYFGSEWRLRNGRMEASLDFIDRGLGLGRANVVCNETVFADDPLMERLEIQQELFRHHGIRWYAGAELARRPDGRVILSVDRLERDERFSLDELRQIDLLSQHLSKAVNITLALDNVSNRSAIDAFQVAGRAAILIGDDMRVVMTNPLAERHTRSGFRVSDGYLLLEESRRSSEFAAYVARVSHPSAGLSDVVTPFLVRRASGRPLVVTAAPPSREASSLLRIARAVLFITDPDEQKPLPSIELVRQVYGLSASESRLVIALAGGGTLETIAATFQVSISTVRNQLASTFVKMGVRRQSDVVAAVLRLQGV